MTVALVVIGAYFQLSALSQGVPVLGLVCVIVYIIGFAIGLGPVFWLMISEIYPLRFRSQAMAVARRARPAPGAAAAACARRHRRSR